MVSYAIVGADEGENIVVFVNGETLTAHSSHPNYTRIVDLAKASDPDVAGLFDVAKTVSKRFETLTERVSSRNGRIYLDGDEVNNALTKQILRFLDEDNEDWVSLVNFFENVLANPDAHSREQLFEWLDRHEFTITHDGMIVGYKGVNRVDDGFTSISHGPAVVDGEEVNGAVPNNIGSIVEMSRSNVVADPAVGCSVGLHVGTFEYARDFSRGAVLEVHVNPRDVVSVPTDCDFQKVRCCRYYVHSEVTEKFKSALRISDAQLNQDSDYDSDEDY